MESFTRATEPGFNAVEGGVGGGHALALAVRVVVIVVGVETSPPDTRTFLWGLTGTMGPDTEDDSGGGDVEVAATIDDPLSPVACVRGLVEGVALDVGGKEGGGTPPPLALIEATPDATTASEETDFSSIAGGTPGAGACEPVRTSQRSRY